MIQTPNAAQKRALDIQTPHDLIVSAAAGSGKTAVMVDRAVRLIEAGMPIQRLLMTTFTNAAAAEMKQRLGKELLDRADHCAPDTARHLRSQALLVHSADICTIDSFCIQLARRYFYLVDLDPLFGLLDESAGLLMRAAALEDVFDDFFSLPPGPERAAFLHTLKALSYGKEEEVKRLILQLHEYKQTLPNGEAWLAEARAHYADETVIRADFDAFCADIRSALPAIESDLQALIQLLETSLQHKKKDEVLFVWQENLAAFRRAAGQMPGPQSAEMLKHLQTKKDACIKKSLSAEDNEAFDTLHKRIKSSLSQLQKHVAYRTGLSGFLAMAQDCVPVFDGLCALLAAFEQTYTEAKKQANAWDFSDISQAALRILRHPQAQKETRALYDAVFIDEVQDTNELQDTILSLIARPKTSFRVGDVKQSIYHFRHTDPSLFLARYHQYSPEDSADQLRIDLKENYRSAANVLHGVNWVMQRCMQPPLSDLAYDESQALLPGRKEEGPPVRLCLLTKEKQIDTEGQPDAEVLSLESGSVAQARAAAQEIRRLLGQTFVDKGVERPYTLSDIVVLVQTRAHVSVFLQTLLEEGIEAISDASAEILTTQECGAMLQVLRVVDSLQDDIDFVTALRSPAGQCSASDLARIRLYQKEQQSLGVLPDRCEYFAAARHLAAHGDGPTTERLRRFFERIERYRQYAHRHSVDQLLLYLYDDCNALAYYGVQPDGAQKTENLIALWQRAQGYAQTGDGSLYGFLQMLDTAARLGGKEPPALPTGGDFVRVMTMHTSKGLEFPAVILPFLEQGMFRNNNASLPLSKKYGVGLWHFHQPSLSKQQTLCYALSSAEKRLAETAERMRLCYVAMTRAKESLILIGQGSQAQLAAACTKSPAEAKNMLEWILPAVALHPDGSALRERFSLSLSAEDAPGAWQVVFQSVQPEIERVYQAHGDWQRFVEGVNPDDARYADALAPLYYRYPFRSAEAPAKIAASQLSDLTQKAQAPTLSWPAWDAVSSKAPDAAQRGTTMHTTLQKIDLARARTIQDAKAQVQAWLKSGAVTQAQADMLDLSLVVRFANSPLARRILAARRVVREQPFVVRIPARMIAPDYPPDETTLLQGILDLAFEEEDGWVLVDYKTDRIPPEGPQALAQRYRGQLCAYRLALARLTGRPVKQALLVLLRTGESIEIAADD